MLIIIAKDELAVCIKDQLDNWLITKAAELLLLLCPGASNYITNS